MPRFTGMTPEWRMRQGLPPMTGGMLPGYEASAYGYGTSGEIPPQMYAPGMGGHLPPQTYAPQTGGGYAPMTGGNLPPIVGSGIGTGGNAPQMPYGGLAGPQTGGNAPMTPTTGAPTLASLAAGGHRPNEYELFRRGGRPNRLK